MTTTEIPHPPTESTRPTEPGAVRPFVLDVPQAELDDLRSRLDRTRLPLVVDEDDATGGIPVSYVRRLVEHWRDGFDWRAAEREINRAEHRMVRVQHLDQHLDQHLVVHRAADPTGVPVVLVHGWPDTFHGFHCLAPLLAAAGHDVVVPSLPGYPLSEAPAGSLTATVAAELVHQAVTALGHERYAVHGADWGAAVAEQLALLHPGCVTALHFSGVPVHHVFLADRDELDDAGRAFVDGAAAWGERASYFSVQSYDPTTLAYGLSDSPVGLAAWLVDKYRAWTDREPDLDEVLTQVSLYWHSNAIRSSMRLYAEGAGEWDAEGTWDDASGVADGADGGWQAVERPQAPTAIAVFPHDIMVAPRSFAEPLFDLRRFTVMGSGGHFCALDEPAALAEDIAGFLAALEG